MKRILTIVALLSITAFAFGQAAIINEWSQGNGGSKEWVEILVVQNNVDMRGWYVIDSGSSRYFTFLTAPDTTWHAVPAGTIILVSNSGDQDVTVLPSFDSSMTDGNFTICTFHRTPSLFTFAGTTGNWPGFSNSGLTDGPRLYDATGTLVHEWDQGTTAFSSTFKYPIANQASRYIGNTVAGITDTANWIKDSANIRHVTPGVGNGGINSAWVASLRNQASPPVMGAVTYAGTSNPAPNVGIAVTAYVTATVNATVNIRYRTGGSGAYTGIAMTNVSDSTWTGNIPGQPDGTLVDYYVDATNQGSSTVRAPSADYHFRVYGTLLTSNMLVVNEIMNNRNSADHTHDWIELYNNTASTIDLTDFMMKDDQNTRSYTLPLGKTIAAHGYYILPYTHSFMIADYPTLDTNIIGPSYTYEFSLPSDSVRVYDVNGNEVNHIGYTGASPWPTTLVGYSMELNNPNNDNTNGANWTNSIAQFGTPGAVNGGTDIVAPVLNSVTTISQYQVVAHFNEPLLSGPANTTSNFQINLGVQIDSAKLAVNGTDVNLYLSTTPLVSGQPYILTANNIADVSSNVAGSLTGGFTWTAPPLPALLITEIMYNPSNPGTANETVREWFEAYNTTANPIDLNGWKIQLGTQANTQQDSIQTSLVVGAGQYIIFSNNLDSLQAIMGITAQHNYNSAGALANSGTPHIIIWDASNVLDDSVMYAVTNPWPSSTNGKSIYLTNYNNDNNLGGSWALSNIQMANGDYGTPGLPGTGLTTQPTLTSPTVGATISEVATNFNWSAYSPAQTYVVQIATDSAFTNIVLNSSGVVPNSLTTNALVPGTHYFWRVRAVYNAVQSPWSIIWSFNTITYAVTMTAPVGSESWLVGSSQLVTWTDNGVDSVSGWYSIDGGSNWVSMFALAANTNSFTWSLPFTPSVNAMVKVLPKIGNFTPSGIFTIGDYHFTFTSPIGGESWMATTQQTISWTDNGVTNLSINVSTDSAVTWTPIASSIANNGSVQWTLPGTTSTNCYLQLVATATGATAVSNRFTISPQLPPPDPTGLTISVVVGSTDANLSWPTVPGATSYTVYSATTQNGTWSIISSGVLTNSYIDAGAVSAGHKLYRVTANN